MASGTQGAPFQLIHPTTCSSGTQCAPFQLVLGTSAPPASLPRRAPQHAQPPSFPSTQPLPAPAFSAGSDHGRATRTAELIHLESPLRTCGGLTVH
jgi:hypothetical protein